VCKILYRIRILSILSMDFTTFTGRLESADVFRGKILMILHMKVCNADRRLSMLHTFNVRGP